MKIFKKEDALYWVVLAIIIIILYFVFSDGQFSLIFTLAGTVQTFGFSLIVLKISRSRSVTGLSLQTFICYTIVFGLRAILFIMYRVRFFLFRDTCLMTLLEISFSGSKKELLPSFLPTSCTALSLSSKLAMTRI